MSMTGVGIPRAESPSHRCEEHTVQLEALKARDPFTAACRCVFCERAVGLATQKWMDMAKENMLISQHSGGKKRLW